MMWQRVVPFLIILLLALIVLVLVLWRRKQNKYEASKERRLAEASWTGDCEFDNPETGATCQRKEFHLENHYHDVGGKLVHWP